jgi:hypothetical protein
MLVHTTLSAAAHEMLRGPVQAYLRTLKTGIERADQSLLTELHDDWERETARLPTTTPRLALLSSEKLEPVTWEQVQERLAGVVADVQVIVDNYQSAARLEYRADIATTAIVIGGNTLSRGLTLEGLLCSYFVRAANAYDTLLQMGRWFGYRRGYADLIRIWMTEELESWFYDLATVEAEIRQEIRRYEDERLKPDQLAVKIRVHPAMAITAAAKMQHAVDAQLSYSGTREQTILFHHRDKDWLLHNIEATARLWRAAAATAAAASDTTHGNRPILRDVPVDVIVDFLEDYQFHPAGHRLRPDLLIPYIEAQDGHGALRKWNLVMMADPAGGKGQLPLGDGLTVNLIHRSRLDMEAIPHANIKALVSKIDRVADLHLPRREIRRMITGDITDAKLRDLRADHLGPVGLLCLYPIAKDSKPERPDAPVRPGQRRRIALDAAAHVIGVGLFFPDASGPPTPVAYRSADLSGMAEDSEEFDIDVLDEADEKAAAAQDADLTAQAARGRGGGG